eukprot:45144_1
MSSSIKCGKSSTLLVYGFIHEIQMMSYDKSNNNVIPDALIQQCLIFYFDPIVSQFVFDEYGMDKTRMQIINDKQVICVKGFTVGRAERCCGSSVRLKCGLPISKRGNNIFDNIKSVSWQMTHTVTHSFPDDTYFIGVVSNRNIDFSNVAYQGLSDARGITGCNGYVYKEGGFIDDYNYKVYPKNAIVKIQYKINESKLFFSYGNGIKLYEIVLPTNNKEITHWYPCISLRDKNDVCKILNVTVN